jgi:aspartate beta-hydroxylase
VELGPEQLDARPLFVTLFVIVMGGYYFTTVRERRARDARIEAMLESDSEDEEVEDAASAALWKRVEGVLAEYCLSKFAMVAARKWVKLLADPANEQLARLRSWLLMRVNGRQRATPQSEWQSGCPEIFDGLRASPVWDTKLEEWLRPFEENADKIRAELLALRDQRGFQPLKIPNWASKQNSIASPDGSGSVSHDQGAWNVFYLYLHEVQFPENCERCPVTTGLLKALGPRSYQHAFFSALTPGTHIIKHHGPTNKKLRVHLPLIGAQGSELRVADQHIFGKEGQTILFDDSFEHEAWHRGEATRIVLVFDIWHPDLTDKEVQFLSFLQKSRMRAEMAAEKAARKQREEAAAAAAAEAEVAGAEAARPAESPTKGEGGAAARPDGKTKLHGALARSRGVAPADDKGDNFYQLLQEAKDILPDNSWWTG